jgi:hypothetical protein
MITVVTLNWARPANTVLNLRRYAAYRSVSQILCFNNGPSLSLMGKLPEKCVLIESTRDLGLHTRLATASLASTEALFHTDDDIVVPEATIYSLYAALQQAPRCCHGLYGREVRPVYQTANVFGPVEVVLTRAVMCSRTTNNAALAAMPYFHDLESVPRGNGEDIILSFAAMASSRMLNIAYPLPSKNYSDETGCAIHQRWPRHLAHRQSVVTRCRQLFGL